MENAGTTKDTSSPSTDAVSFTTMTIYVHPLIHERQRLQLCALHSINNLLQLDLGLDGDSDGDDVHVHNKTSDSIMSKTVMLCGGRVYTLDEKMPYGYVTKAELDTVADELTVKEEQWFQNNAPETTMDEGRGDRDGGAGGISFWKKMWSHHRTPFTGNYSLEVLQETLSRRNISLQWYNQNSIPTELFGDHSESRNILLGFIVNSLESFSFTKPSSYIGMGSGRHWYAITRVRRVGGLMEQDDGNRGESGIIFDNNGANMNMNLDTFFNTSRGTLCFINSETNQSMAYDRDMWHLIDSSSKEIWDMTSGEVMELIENVTNEKGSVLLATLKL